MLFLNAVFRIISTIGSSILISHAKELQVACKKILKNGSCVRFKITCQQQAPPLYNKFLFL